MSIRGIIERVSWMFKVKDCRHICLFCGFYDICRADEKPEKEEKGK